MDIIGGNEPMLQYIPDLVLPVRICLEYFKVHADVMTCECESVQGIYEWVRMECRFRHDAHAKGL